MILFHPSTVEVGEQLFCMGPELGQHEQGKHSRLEQIAFALVAASVVKQDSHLSSHSLSL